MITHNKGLPSKDDVQNLFSGSSKINASLTVLKFLSNRSLQLFQTLIKTKCPIRSSDGQNKVNFLSSRIIDIFMLPIVLITLGN